MIVTTKAVPNGPRGDMYILCYIGSVRKPIRVAHDYETYIDSIEAHVRAAKAAYRQRKIEQGVSGAELMGVKLDAHTHKLPDVCNHDWCIEVEVSGAP